MIQIGYTLGPNQIAVLLVTPASKGDAIEVFVVAGRDDQTFNILLLDAVNEARLREGLDVDNYGPGACRWYYQKACVIPHVGLWYAIVHNPNQAPLKLRGSAELHQGFLRQAAAADLARKLG